MLEPLSWVLCSGCQQTWSHQWTLVRHFEARILLLDRWWRLSRPLEGSSRWPSQSWRSSSAWPCTGRSYHSSRSLRSFLPGIHTDQTWLKICLDHYGRNRDSYIELSYMKADVIIHISNMDYLRPLSLPLFLLNNLTKSLILWQLCHNSFKEWHLRGGVK